MSLVRPSISARQWLQSALLAASLLLTSITSNADESRHDFLVFASIDTFNNFAVSNPDTEDSFVRPSLDFLYSYSGGRFRFLGEYLLSTHESELERLKIGWQAGDNTVLWLGRFHSTAKFWTSEYHHGQFLQTSITRPSIDEWEDESGPMPSHITGLSIEHQSQLASESAIDFALSAGLAPKFIDEELVPFDMLDPESDYGLAVNYRMAYRRSVVSDSQVGFTIAWHDIDVVSESNPELTDLNDIQQTSVGVFADWRWEKWRLLGHAAYFANELNYSDETIDDQFASGYLQLEFEAAKNWIIFGRGDGSYGEDDSEYLDLLPAFIAHRLMLGVRWDFRQFQSLTAEVARTSAQGEGVRHNSFNEVRFQWSGVFP
jgi:hypothetical protein